MTGKRLLIVEDDVGLAETLAQSFARRGYECEIAFNTETALRKAERSLPDFAIIDLKLQDKNGLDCVKQLARIAPSARIVVLTGFASIATAVEAIKLGASHYLAKPATAAEIEAGFSKVEGDTEVPLTPRRANLRTNEWEIIHQTLRETDFNISETARRLGMHRRTLARKLAKQQVG